MRRMLLVLAVSAVLVVALAMPVFADSFASESNEEGGGPNSGLNFGHCKNSFPDATGTPGKGQETAQGNPSFGGGPGEVDRGILCGGPAPPS